VLAAAIAAVSLGNACLKVKEPQHQLSVSVLDSHHLFIDYVGQMIAVGWRRKL